MFLACQNALKVSDSFVLELVRDTGLHSQLHGDFMGFAVIGLVEAVENAQHAIRRVTVVTCPLAERHPALAEVLFDLLGCHGRGSCVEVVNQLL